MRLKGLVAEDFANYKIPSMFLITCYCDWKCCKEGNFDESVCQNNSLINTDIIEVPDDIIIDTFIADPITKAVVIGGLEPILQAAEVLNFIEKFREECSEEIVIYTGYNKDEIQWFIDEVSLYDNIIIKFGRYIPGQKPHYDEILGVELASDNQYAERIS